MAMKTPASSPSTSVKQLRFAFPFRKKAQGSGSASTDFTNEHEVHKLLKREPLGGYAVSGKGMWHGGIHVTEAGAGQSLDLKHGVLCIADGEVVAWRLNRVYPVSEIAAQDGKPAFHALYSTGFALVRHTIEFPKDTKLTFFSLYMHLQDLAGYEADKTLRKPAYWSPDFKVTGFAKDKPRPSGDQTAPAQQAGLRVRASQPHGAPLCILPQGTQISLGKREGNWGKIRDTHGAKLIPPRTGEYVAPSAAVDGWVFLGDENGGRVVEEMMPESSLDCVVVPSTPIPIKAGELIGHLGRYDSLTQQTSNRMVHIEVFCGEDIKSFIDKGRTWISANGAQASAWKQLGLPADPTILRVDKKTTLYKAINQPGQDAPQTDVIQVSSLAELGKQRENQYTETKAGSDGLKCRWWKVESADVLRHDITGWVREQNFAGGRVTREFPQKWVDFETFDDPHDQTHTIFANTKAFVDYSMGADMPERGALSKLNPLMGKIYRALYPTGEQSRAADELCAAAEDPWRALRMSRLIIKHESEWANAGKWKQLIGEIEKQTGPRPQHAAAQERIQRLVWWDDVKASVVNFPAPKAFHINPIGLIGNFTRSCCSALEISVEALRGIAQAASEKLITDYISPLNQAFSDYQFNSCVSQAHFLAQILHESGEFQFTNELGGKKSYDPWRGRGLIQITLKRNYEAYQAYSRQDFTSNQPAIESLEKPPHALLSAAWFYVVKSDLMKPGADDDFIWVTRIINGGFNGYDDRLRYFNRAARVLNLQNCLKLNIEGRYRFEDSRAYNEKRASCAWGLWNDPGLNKTGISHKTIEEAAKGYRRYLELDLAAGSPTNKNGQPKDEGWYGLKGSVKSFVNDRLKTMESAWKKIRNTSSSYLVASGFLIAALNFWPPLTSAANTNVAGDFEGNNMTEIIFYRNTSKGLSIEYYSPSLNKTFLYKVNKFDECSSMAIYKIANTRQIAIDGSCFSQGGQIYREIYEWKPDHSNWCLIRKITGERAELAANKYLPSEQVLRTRGCSTIGEQGPYDYKPAAEVTKDIELSLEKFRSAREKATSLSRYIDSFTDYDAAELADYVNEANVRDVNDIAYFLAERGRPDDAIPILETILKRFPKRIVTKLNLADAYWDIGITAKASVLYSQYHQDIASNNMKTKIPTRVVDRMK